jgi:hypothetical protein
VIKVIVNHPHTEAGPEGFDKKPSEYGLGIIRGGPKGVWFLHVKGFNV